MIAIYLISAVTLAVLGIAFLICWNAARMNQAALLWGVAHLALAGASYLGYRFQLEGLPLAGLLSTVLTALFLVCLHGATEAMRARPLGLRTLGLRTLGVALLIAVVGFAGDQMAGRLLVMVLMQLTYGATALFLWRMQERLAGAALAFKALSYLLYLAELQAVGTPFQSLHLLWVGWLSNLLLGLVLIDLAIRLAQQRLNNVLKYLPDPLVARNLQGQVVFCNERFAQLAGAASPAALVGQKVPLLAREEMEADAVMHKITAMVQAANLDETIRLERQIEPVQGASFPAELLFSSYTNLGAPVVLCQIRDLSEHKRAEQERLRQANTDPLTGLANRAFLLQQLDAVLWVAQRQGTGCAVLLLDLDHFKKINDSLGHARGDEVLRHMAALLQGQVQEGDLLARVSGDEFVLVLTALAPHSGILQVEARAQALLARLRQHMTEEGGEYPLDASIGIALSHGGALDQGATLLQQAEVAMYEAKGRGRGSWCFFDSTMDTRLAESLRLEAALRLAIAHHELQLHYQPIYAAASGQLAKVEALVRWHNPQLGWVSPARFIPLAEESALILDIGQWVLDEALRQLAQWRTESGSAPVMSINVSARQFAQPGFEERLWSGLQRHGLPPASIELELTETLLVGQDDGVGGLLQRLHTAGVGLSLDDFGTGYSSLSYLAHFRLHTVKIDRSFVMNLQEGSRNHSLVRAIIAMAHSLHLKVVAEGVESAQQRAILQAEGCDFLQGYLLGRPMPLQELRRHPAQLASE
ncbi:EAL domain-containing protein [Acidovorax sp. HDW3]|uniref:putative bifunctional diguanylate cyclase/phosphodiesterase n=1 Tax=Acidovorax sp. HDW3 TaxID=2714923 RepID=UPI001407B75F|nr:EAL domain-containing protein [Acidovorax sp. HDW3]QIL43960.1 EAL domain-containing protein [Acidovorax sp. HDW3]